MQLADTKNVPARKSSGVIDSSVTARYDHRLIDPVPASYADGVRYRPYNTRPGVSTKSAKPSVKNGIDGRLGDLPFSSMFSLALPGS